MKTFKKLLSLKRKYIRDENRKRGVHLERVDYWDRDFGDAIGVCAVWRSKDFLVQVYQKTPNGIRRLSICRTELDRDGMWKDGITWEDLQRIKSECGYGAFDAVEIFPRDYDVVNVANMRHLWIYDTPIPFAWRNPPESTAQTM